MMMSRDFLDRVRSAQGKINGLITEASEAAKIFHSKSDEAERLWDKMNFRERHLAGWFGGDKAKVRNHLVLEREARILKFRIRKLKFNIDKLERGLLTYISKWLFSNDSSYQEISKTREAVEKMKKSADLFADKIDRALSEIDDAQGMETLDLVTKNKGISFLSYVENSQANDAIGAVNRGAGAFQKSLNEYNGFLKERKLVGVIVRVDDGFDLMMDVIFDGFDFSSLFTLSALSGAESQLRKARSKVSKIQKVLDASFRGVKSADDAYLKRVRSGLI